uniref:Integrin alpha-L n=1 Tax=Epinephelus coioides TaxID=94232 RepID=A0A223Q047_EPICO|nr:integrin alpha-L [Epinephelus coioides]
MYGQQRIFLLIYMVAVAITVSLAFNIDLTNPDVYTGKQKDFFGYKVLQYKSDTTKGIIVTAPLQENGSGGICKPERNQSTNCFNPKEISRTNTKIPVKHLGLSVAEDFKRSEFTVCSPSVVHECYENSYVNSVCYKITDHLQEISHFTPAFQECTKKTVDLVFLFDGSKSMTENEFSKNKDFIEDIMNNLKNSSIKFAAVQFSTEYRKVFDFNDYQNDTHLPKLKQEHQMKSLTNTHRALKFVLKEILESSDAGASPDATKVLVMITDGDPSDGDAYGILKEYNDKNIIRFVIVVKGATLDKFEEIASKPREKYAFKIEEYDGLTTILENFQKKIFSMEGTKEAQAGDMTDEMSQSGFSAVFYNERLILGSVGSNSWRGSLQDIHGEDKTQIEDPLMEMDSYMGYSISVGKKNNVALYFTGAPRFNHTGQIIIFRQNDKKWYAAQKIEGKQIGSYFGAELCSVDVNSDGDTDFLLVGAPLFYQPQENKEGQIVIYTLTNEMQLNSEWNVTASFLGRFGTTISSLADLNGDGLRDVAVGAPLEDNNSGAVYIYLGDRQRGIRDTFSQRIMGQKIDPGLRFFGQSIDGDIDLGEDGLPDIVVGSQGNAIVLRSRPVLNVTAQLSFTPKEISTDKIDCLDNKDEHLPMVTLTACFKIVETTKSNTAKMSSGLNISWTLNVDPMRQTPRGFFSPSDKKTRNLTSTQELREDTCFNYSIYMPKCVKDTLSPISIKLNFSQVDSKSASAILNMDSKRQAAVEVPFEKHCRKNDTCIAELEVDFNFMSPTLLVVENNYFNISVTLSNHGDDSYYTSLIMHYPPGLSFSMMALKKATRPTVHSCRDLQEIHDRSICDVSRPVFRSRTSATFRTSFRVLNNYEWDDTISMNVTGKSDNADSTRISSMAKSIPVQYQIKMAVTVKDDPITYINFTAEDAGPKKLVAIYKIDNLGFKAFPISVSLFFPTKLEHNFEMTNYQVYVQQNKTECTATRGIDSEYCTPEKYCKVIECHSFILEKESPTEFTLSGDIQFKDLKQHAANIAFLKRYTGDSAEVKFKSFIQVDYDKNRYLLDSHKQQQKSGNDPTMKWTEVRVEFIIPPNQLQIIATGAGLGFLLLIIIAIIMFKLGCFKRKTLEYYQEMEEEATHQAGTPTKSTTAPTQGADSHSETDNKPDPPPEEKTLLDDGETNGSIQPADPEKGLN